MSLAQKLAKQIALGGGGGRVELNCVTGEILSQGEGVSEPSLGRGKFFQHVRNETDIPLRGKKRDQRKEWGGGGGGGEATRIQTEL